MLSVHDVTLQRRQQISVVALCTGFLHKKGSCRPLKKISACRKRPVLALVQLKIWFAPWQQELAEPGPTEITGFDRQTESCHLGHLK